MTQPVAVHVPVIGFRTKGDWTAYDLSTLLASCSTIYNIFDAIYTFMSTRTHSIAFYKSIIQYYEPYLTQSAEGQQYLDLVRKWLQLSTEYSERGAGFFPPGLEIPPLPPEPLNFELQSFPVSITQLYQQRETFLGNSLRIYRIKMSSPGAISFSGVSGIIRECREFIKDIWYRNRQEKVKGNLEIIDQYLSIRTKLRDVNQAQIESMVTNHKLANALADSVADIRSLEERKLLDDVPSNLEYVSDK